MDKISEEETTFLNKLEEYDKNILKAYRQEHMRPSREYKTKLWVSLDGISKKDLEKKKKSMERTIGFLTEEIYKDWQGTRSKNISNVNDLVRFKRDMLIILLSESKINARYLIAQFPHIIYDPKMDRAYGSFLIPSYEELKKFLERKEEDYWRQPVSESLIYIGGVGFLISFLIALIIDRCQKEISPLNIIFILLFGVILLAGANITNKIDYKNDKVFKKTKIE